MHSLYGYLGSPSPRNARRIVRGLGTVQTDADKKTFAVVNGRQQLTTAARTAAMALLANTSFTSQAAAGADPNGSVITLTGTPPASGAPSAKDWLDTLVAGGQTAILSPIFEFQKFAWNGDNDAVPSIAVAFTKDKNTIDALSVAGGSGAVLSPVSTGANTQTNLASSGGDGGGTIVLVGLAAVAAIALAMSAGKKTPAVANPMHRMNRHVPTVRVSM
jgi:hypothetical protein